METTPAPRYTQHIVLEWGTRYTICTECGALVPYMYSKVHDQWHADHERKHSELETPGAWP